MDGNRRWAKKKKLSSLQGHRYGAEVLLKVVKAAAKIGISTLSVFVFSTENWARKASEIRELMRLLRFYLTTLKKEMIQEEVRLKVIGDLSRLPKMLQKLIDKVEEETKGGRRIELVLAINYGGKNEIVRAVTSLVKDFADKKIDLKEISESLIATYLDTHGIKDPDLLIRTSGEMRISNFFLWQISYAEMYMTDVLWPDFNEEHLMRAIEVYQHRIRRQGQ